MEAINKITTKKAKDHLGIESPDPKGVVRDLELTLPLSLYLRTRNIKAINSFSNQRRDADHPGKFSSYSLRIRVPFNWPSDVSAPAFIIWVLQTLKEAEIVTDYTLKELDTIMINFQHIDSNLSSLDREDAIDELGICAMILLISK